MADPTNAGLHDECTLILDSDGIDSFHQFLASWWERLWRTAPPDPDVEMAFTLMLGELVANVAGHAYAGMPEQQRWLRVRFDLLPACVRGELRDRGNPFENATERLCAAGHDDNTADKESGRGLRILTQLADSVEYDRTGTGENVWRVTKCFRPSPADSPDMPPTGYEDGH